MNIKNRQSKLEVVRNSYYDKVKEDIGVGDEKSEKIERKFFRYFRKINNNNASSIFVFFLFLGCAVAGGIVSLLFLTELDIQVRDFSYVVAVILAGLVSLSVSETNKENEINKHREKWCSDLRVYISEFATAANVFQRNAFKGEGGKEKTPFEVVEKFYENSDGCRVPLAELDRLHHVLAIYLYPELLDKPEWKLFKKVESIKNGLEACLKDMRENIISAKEGNSRSSMEVKNRSLSTRINNLCGDEVMRLVVGTKVYLDDEWKKIKRGRPWFKIKRGILMSLIAFLLSMFVVFIAFSSNESKEENNKLSEVVDVES